MIDSAHFVKSTPKSFHRIFSAFCRYITDVLTMCMKEFDAETIFFKKFTGPLTLIAIIRRLHIVNNG